MKQIKLGICVVLCLAFLCSCSGCEVADEPVTPVNEGDSMQENTNTDEPVTPSNEPVAPVNDPVTPVNEGDTTQENTSDENNMEVKSEIFRMIRSILDGEATFFDTGSQKSLYISELNQMVSSDSKVTADIKSFAVIDLDDDGLPEVVLWLIVNGNDFSGYAILHYQNEEIYGYSIYYRGFTNLKKDGTFSFSSGAADGGIGRLTFDDQTRTIDKYAYSESRQDSNGQLIISYVLFGKKASREEVENEWKKHDAKEDAIWYDFTDENVEEYIR